MLQYYIMLRFLYFQDISLQKSLEHLCDPSTNNNAQLQILNVLASKPMQVLIMFIIIIVLIILIVIIY